MRTTFFRTLMLFVFFAFVITLFSCGDDKEEEVRIYVTDSTPDDAYYISAVYVVKSPSGNAGNWGDSILNGNTSGPNGWQKYTFNPGTYDYRVVYWGKYWSSDDSSFLEQTAYDQTAEDGQGIKFDLDGYTLYTTTFTFNH